jgi:hypothetical protein
MERLKEPPAFKVDGFVALVVLGAIAPTVVNTSSLYT